MSKRSLMLVNSLFRLTYGVGALLAPTKIASARLAADTEGQPQARLFVRGFGAHQVAVALLGLASRRWRRAADTKLSTIERFANALGYSIEYHLVPAKTSKRRTGVVVEQG